MTLDQMLVLAYAGTFFVCRSWPAFVALLLMIGAEVYPAGDDVVMLHSTFALLYGIAASIVGRVRVQFAFVIMALYLATYALDCVVNSDVETLLYYLHPAITVTIHVCIIIALFSSEWGRVVIRRRWDADRDLYGDDDCNNGQNWEAGAP